MKVITNSVEQQIYVPSSLKEIFCDKKFCFLDIETTGFSRINDSIILIGILYVENDSAYIKQYFAEALSEEKSILASFAEFVSDFDILVNYNGDTFDIPFINAKLLSNNLNYRIDQNKSLDLMKIVKRNIDLLEIDNYKLKTVEKLLGIERIDKITGKESVELYRKYLLTNDDVMKKIILKHNYDDIFYLPQVLRIYDLIAKNNILSFNVLCTNKSIDVFFDLGELGLKKHMLYINGYTDKMDLSTQVHYGDYYYFEWEPSLGIYKLRIQLLEGSLSNGNKCYYINTDDYIVSLMNCDDIEYNIPSNIIIIKDKNRYMRNNIKMLLKETLAYIFSSI